MNIGEEKKDKVSSQDAVPAAPLSAENGGNPPEGTPTKVEKAGQEMQLPLNGGSSGASSGPAQSAGAPATTAPQQHSPGSTSSVSSNGSNVGGYTRQSNPRPRKHNSSSSNNQNTSTSTAASTSSPRVPISTSLPPSAVTAPPYVPRPPLQNIVDYGSQPPPPYGFIDGSYAPVYYPYQTSPVTEFVPPPTRGIPPPAMANAQSAAKPTGVGSNPQGPPGRYTPSPHSVSGSSSPSSFCHQNGAAPTSIAPTSANAPVAMAFPPGAVPVPAVASPSGAAGAGQQHVVNYHIHQGEVISLQMGDGNMQVIPGRNFDQFVKCFF
jgi:hypothetical protein